MSFRVDVSLAVWFGFEHGRVLSETGSTATSRPSSDGKTGNRGVEDGGSDHPQGSGRESHAGRRSEAYGVPRAYAATLDYQVQEDRVGAVAETRQLVAKNLAVGSGQMDSNYLV